VSHKTVGLTLNKNNIYARIQAFKCELSFKSEFNLPRSIVGGELMSGKESSSQTNQWYNGILVEPFTFTLVILLKSTINI
jgi:hypothetical protein